MHWDIFCRVIDNHGDLGVCWRLSADLAQRGEQVRLWVDDACALAWMAPQGRTGVSVHSWTTPGLLAQMPAADVRVEAFGCEVPTQYLLAGTQVPPVWINLEYLCAEPYVEQCHGLPSPVMSGPCTGQVKHFFFPGFTPRTGGLLREPGLMAERDRFDAEHWLQSMGLTDQTETLRVSLFCYEPPALASLLQQWRDWNIPAQLLVTAGRATQAVQRAIQIEMTDKSASAGDCLLSISYINHLPQTEFDHLLWSCELNFVRGEDSLVRALWAGQALVWQIYPQEDNAHHAKLEAFLEWLEAPASLRQFHRIWNGLCKGPLPRPDLPAWRKCVIAARDKLLVQDDLTTQLLGFASRIR